MIFRKLLKENKIPISLIVFSKTLLFFLLCLFFGILLEDSVDAYQGYTLKNMYEVTAMLSEDLSENQVREIFNALEEFDTKSIMEGNLLYGDDQEYSTRFIYDSKNEKQYYNAGEDFGLLSVPTSLIKDQFTYQKKHDYDPLFYTKDESIIAFIINKENLENLIYSEAGLGKGIEQYLNNLVIEHSPENAIDQLKQTLNDISEGLEVNISKYNLRNLLFQSFYIALFIATLFALLLFIFTIILHHYIPFTLKNNKFIKVYSFYGIFNRRANLQIALFILGSYLLPVLISFSLLTTLFGRKQQFFISFFLFLFIQIIASTITIKNVLSNFKKGPINDESFTTVN